MEIADRLDEIHEKEDIVYVDLSGKRVNIMEDISLVTEDIASQTIQSFKELLMSTTENLISTIEFLKHDLKVKTNTIDSLLKHINYLVETTPCHVDIRNSSFDINCNTQEDPKVTSNNLDTSKTNLINENNNHSTSRILISHESSDKTINLNTSKSPDESYECQLKQYKLKRHSDFINAKSLKGIDNINHPGVCESENKHRYLITIDECDSPTDYGITKSKWHTSGNHFKNNSIMIDNDDSVSSVSDSTTSFASNSPTNNNAWHAEFNNDVRCVRHYKPSNRLKENVRINSSSVNNNVHDNASNKINNIEVCREQNGKHPWPQGTVLIAGSSIVIGLEEKRMGKTFKVRGFSGAIIQDMYSYLQPLLEKKPTYLILMVGTNDAANKDKNAESIMVELLRLKYHIENVLPSCSVILSCPTLRSDSDNSHAKKIVFDLRKKLINLNLPLILNENITEKHLGKLGLHLNKYGLARLAMNYMQFIRQH